MNTKADAGFYRRKTKDAKERREQEETERTEPRETGKSYTPFFCTRNVLVLLQ